MGSVLTASVTPAHWISARKGQFDNRVSPHCPFHHSFAGGPKHLCVSFELQKKKKKTNPQKNQTHQKTKLRGSLREELHQGLSSLSKLCHFYQICLILMINILLLLLWKDAYSMCFRTAHALWATPFGLMEWPFSPNVLLLETGTFLIYWRLS